MVILVQIHSLFFCMALITIVNYQVVIICLCSDKCYDCHERAVTRVWTYKKWNTQYATVLFGGQSLIAYLKEYAVLPTLHHTILYIILPISFPYSKISQSWLDGTYVYLSSWLFGSWIDKIKQEIPVLPISYIKRIKVTKNIYPINYRHYNSEIF